MRLLARTALVWLAFPMNTHQNANQKPLTSVPPYQAQCTLPPQLIYQTLHSPFPRGSGNETIRIVEVVSIHSMWLILDWKHCHFVAALLCEYSFPIFKKNRPAQLRIYETKGQFGIT